MTPSDSQPGEKICAICHRDCSTRARTKDDAGRYYCRECVERTKHARAARIEEQAAARARRATPPPQPAVDDSDDTALDLLAEAVDESAEAPPIAVPPLLDAEDDSEPIYTARGLLYESETERPSINLSVPEFIKAPWFAFVMPAGILGSLFLLAQTAPEHARNYLGIVSVFSVVVGLAILIEAFRHSIGMGLLTLCVPFFALYFVLAVNENAHLKALFAVSVMGYIGSFLLVPDIAATLPAMPGATP